MNDASHSVGEVVNTLRSSFESSRLSPRQANDLTELVDREGRAILVVGEYKDCATVRDRMHQRCRAMAMETPLNTRVVPSHVVAHQAFAIRLLGWLVKLFGRCSGFRALFAEVFFSVRRETEEYTSRYYYKYKTALVFVGR